MTYWTIGFGVLILVIVGLLAYGSRRGSGGIVLPEEPADVGSVGEPGGDSNLNIIAISPETVQSAISTLSRPLSYSRTQTVEIFWSGGSGRSVYQVYVNGGQTRLDTKLADGSVRHTLLSGDAMGVWYDSERNWTRLRAAASGADFAGRMPAYETVFANRSSGLPGA